MQLTLPGKAKLFVTCSVTNLMYEDGKEEVSLPVIWAPAEDLLSPVAQARDFEGKLFVKVMADGGQGF